MIDYTIYYKEQLSVSDAWDSRLSWDYFVSAYVPAERTTTVFQKVSATHKRWLLFNEYEYDQSEHPNGECFESSHTDESDYVGEFWDTLPNDAASARICIDITGFIRPYLVYLVRYLMQKGVRQFDAIYSEPIQYQKRELTTFSGDVVKDVRQIAACEGQHTLDTSKDVLIIGAGYEDNLISHVAESKVDAQKLQVIGFPSLRADMYQENVLRVSRAEESLGRSVEDEVHSFFAPANDPFVAATELSRIVEDWESKKGLTNLYLCPLSTKAHVLGFTLYYLKERLETATSMLFPFEERYSRNTSKGIARIWKYHVELPSR